MISLGKNCNGVYLINCGPRSVPKDIGEHIELLGERIKTFEDLSQELVDALEGFLPRNRKVKNIKDRIIQHINNKG